MQFSVFPYSPAVGWLQDKTATAFCRFIFCTQALCRFILTGYWVHDKTVALITVLLCYCSQTLNQECYSIEDEQSQCSHEGYNDEVLNVYMKKEIG